MVLSAGREKFIDSSIVPARNISIVCAMEMLFDLDIGCYIKDSEKTQNWELRLLFSLIKKRQSLLFLLA
jgi:hypothetical protein